MSLNILNTTESMSVETFEYLSHLTEARLGIRMPFSKKGMLESRLCKRMKALQCSTYDLYAQRLRDDHQEFLHFTDAITTNKTDFFREQEHFELLSTTVIPKLLPLLHQQQLRVWSAASSSGEEPYTLAIVLNEFFREHPPEPLGQNPLFSVFATDVSQAMVAHGRAGVYSESSIESIPCSLQSRYFNRSVSQNPVTYRAKPSLRKRVHFQCLNLMDGSYALAHRYHAIFCRNVLIYFKRETQHQVLRRLVQYLVPGGFLFLGHAESLAGHNLPLENWGSAVYRKQL